MKKLIFTAFAVGALLVSCSSNSTNDANDGNKKNDQMPQDTVTHQQTTQQAADSEAVAGVVSSEMAKHGSEKSSGCWYCADYNILTGPTNGAPPLSSPQRICGPDWSFCPPRAKLDDGSVWAKATPSNCSCDK